MIGVILAFQHFGQTKDACSLDILQNAVWELLNVLATEAVGDQASHLLETVLESFAKRTPTSRNSSRRPIGRSKTSSTVSR
jgi:hypothetical protein